MACQIGLQHGPLRSSNASGGGWRGGQTEPKSSEGGKVMLRTECQRGRD